MTSVVTSQAERLKSLIKASQSLASIETQGEVLGRLMALAQEVTGAEASSVLLYNPARQVLEFSLAENERLRDGQAGQLLKPFELALGQGLAGWVAKERQSVIVADVTADPRFYPGPDRSTGFTTRCILCVPVLYNQELLGVIEVLNPKGRGCFDADDQAILESFASLAAVAVIRSRLLAARLERERLETQLEAASRIQAHFRPRLPELGHGSHLYATSLPAHFVGGDLCDCLTLPDGSLVVSVADVAGKGLPAALVMAALWAAVRSQDLGRISLPEAVSRVNESMFEMMAGEVFATMILARYQPASGDLELVCAGHPAPLNISPDGFAGVATQCTVPVGVQRGTAFAATRCCILPGQSVLILTDGVTEARNQSGELFAEKAQAAALGRLSGPPYGPGLLQAVMDFTAREELCDDLTIFEVWRDPA